MRNLTCCFTGHRHIPRDSMPQIKFNLEREIRKLILQGVRYFGAGGALGFDTIAALTILELKKLYPEIKLILVLPCKDQTRNWLQKDIETYQFILERADKVVYTSTMYSPGCMYKRNRHLVDNSAYCIYYLTHNSGGTAYTVRYAKEKGLITIPI